MLRENWAAAVAAVAADDKCGRPKAALYAGCKKGYAAAVAAAAFVVVVGGRAAACRICSNCSWRCSKASFSGPAAYRPMASAEPEEEYSCSKAEWAAAAAAAVAEVVEGDLVAAARDA